MYTHAEPSQTAHETGLLPPKVPSHHFAVNLSQHWSFYHYRTVLYIIKVWIFTAPRSPSTPLASSTGKILLIHLAIYRPCGGHKDLLYITHHGLCPLLHWPSYTPVLCLGGSQQILDTTVSDRSPQQAGSREADRVLGVGRTKEPSLISAAMFPSGCHVPHIPLGSSSWLKSIYVSTFCCFQVKPS